MNLCTAIHYLKSGYTIKHEIDHFMIYLKLELPSWKLYTNNHPSFKDKCSGKAWECSLSANDLEYDDWEIHYGEEI